MVVMANRFEQRQLVFFQFKPLNRSSARGQLAFAFNADVVLF